MHTLTHLYSYPVKACGVLEHAEIVLDSRGLIWDRRWMVVDAEGMFLTQRNYPSLALIQPAFEDDQMRLNAPDMGSIVVPLRRDSGPIVAVTVWKDICEAWDEGAEAAGWFSEYLGLAVRLVRMTESFFRRVDPRYAPEPAQTGFSDGFPLLVVTEESLAELNRRLVERGAQPVPMSRFRPNVVAAGGEPFEEDTWQTIQINGVTLDIVKPCARCKVTTVDQITGSVPEAGEPLATLNAFRRQGGKAMFAQNAIHRNLGTLKVGSRVEVMSFQVEM